MLLLQNSWRDSLRQKFKRCRAPLVSEGIVEEMRSRYGHPGLTGRKRKSSVSSEGIEAQSSMKTPRFKVLKFYTSTIHISCYS